MGTSDSEKNKATWNRALFLGALGIVFGDIGTSPLYTMRECMASLPDSGEPLAILGVLSLIFWALFLVVCIKYVSNIMRADNKGEGGVFALYALSGLKEGKGRRGGVFGGVLIVLFAASLLFGESTITPAITVLSAVEGLNGVDFGLPEHFSVMLTVAILLVLFLFQKRGTGKVGQIFGPIMLVWFIVLGVVGICYIAQYPFIVRAINPMFGLRLLLGGLPSSCVTLVCGSVVLAVTGVEALYADMGHFNRTAISKAWYFVVMPCLVLNYFGQGAYVFSHPESTNPFFEMIPEGFLRYGMSFFSIVAAVIASQAVITGAFSVTLAAIQMGYFPRLKVLHTSSQISGQIYVPFINFILAAVSLAIVIVFKTSSSLAVAYGVAVTGAMIVTTWLYYFYLINQREWEHHKAILLCGFLWVIDWAMFLSAMHKFVGVGWVAFLVSLVFFVIMHTWRSGRKAVSSAIEGSGRHLEELKVTSVVRSKQLQRVSGCAVFMSASTKGIPVVLMHYIKVSKCLHNTTVILTLATEKTPVVDDRDRLQVRDLGEGIWKVRCSYGYMEQPDVNHLCSMMVASGIPLVLDETTFFFNREIVVSGGQSKLFEWQKYLYSFLARNAQPMRDYYRVMQHQLIEVGLPVRI